MASLTTKPTLWVRDCRIPLQHQLAMSWYAGSGLDKGHLSRREDAEWGTTRSLAHQASALTHFYTNAAPQHPGFNQRSTSDTDTWSCLERWILERGVLKEGGKTARICIFSGPVFQDSDPVRSGVKLAVSFFKIVVWYEQGGRLRTTAWELSQEALLRQHLALEELQLDALMRPDQRSLRWIADHTGLVFDRTMHETDTHRAPGNAAQGNGLSEADYDALPGSLQAADPCKARPKKSPVGAPTI
ncbi:MAG: DNA/RNA non-specific endonuclease [Rhodocyclaceae bacterium]|nr:DNA/RNA non-specific endonuclease [Rhodocyclaceae bacterium]